MTPPDDRPEIPNAITEEDIGVLLWLVAYARKDHPRAYPGKAGMRLAKKLRALLPPENDGANPS